MNKSPVHDITELGWFTRWRLKRGRMVWMLDPFSGNSYSFVVHNNDLYLVAENGLNRRAGNA